MTLQAQASRPSQKFEKSVTTTNNKKKYTPKLRGEWKRASRQNPCPVCGGVTKCSFTTDGSRVHCHRTPSDKPGNGVVPNWLHLLLTPYDQTASAADLRPIIPPAQVEPEQEAEAATRSEIYKALLEALEINQRHRRELTGPKRQLNDREIAALGVKSLPGDSRPVCARLAQKFGREALLTVPGFFVNKRGQVQLNSSSGLLFPVFDPYQAGQIAAIRVRPDDPAPGGAKYFPLSSAKFDGPGATVKAAIYYPLDGVTKPERIGITEGEFKAFIAAQREGYPFISVPGTGAWRAAGAVELAKSVAETAVIFYDSELNEQTTNQRDELVGTLSEAGLKIWIAEWDNQDGEFKGIDDLLLQGGAYTTWQNIAGLKVDRAVCERYLPDLEFTKKVTLVRSPKGSGKTEMLARLLNILPSKATVMAISHRVVLLEELSRRLALEFYQDYKGSQRVDRKGLTKAERLAICLDSLIHLDKATNRTYIILDEAEQILRHLTASTIKDRRRRVLAMFKELLKQADYIIGLDADLSPITYRFFKRLLGAENIEVVVNTFQREDAAPIYQYDGRAAITALILSTLKAGQKCYIATNSKAEALLLDTLIKTELPELKGLCITQDNSADPFIRKITRNLNAHIESYTYLICSPTLGTGIDISRPHFTDTFLIGVYHSTTASDLLQHAARNRAAERIHAYVQPGEHHEPTDPQYWQRQCIEKAEKTGLVLDEEHQAATGERIAARFELDYLELWADIKASEKASMNSLAANFYAQAEREGHRVIVVNADDAPGEIEEVLEARKAVKDQLEVERRETMLAAPSVSDEEAAKMEAKAYKTSGEQAIIERHRIEYFYGEDISEELIEADDKGRTMTRLNNFMMLTGTISPTERDRAQLDDMQKLLPDQRHYTLATEARLALLEASGITFRKEFTAADLAKRSFSEWATHEKERLYRDVGLTVKSDIEEKPVQLVAAALAQLGLKLTCRRVGGRGQQERIYQLDQIQLAVIEQLAVSRLAALKERAAQRLKEETPPSVEEPAA